MESRTMLPLIDKVFLSLGALLAIMAQMELIKSIPVEIAEVGTGAAVIQQGELSILSLTSEGMTLDGVPVSRSELVQDIAGRRLVLRADKDMPTQETFELLAELVRAGADVSVEVRERHKTHGGHP